MIIVKLQGGLGNQMFQYAVGRSLQQTNEILYLDHEFFKRTETTTEFIARKYELGVFKNLRARKAKNRSVKLFKSGAAFFKMMRWLYKPVCITQKENELVSFAGLENCRHVYLDGYFQSEKYFRHIRNQLLREFEFPVLDSRNTAIKEQICGSENAVSIHIRRSDYLIPGVLKIHGVLPFHYYYTALNKLKAECKDITLFFFSDDMKWAKENFNHAGLAAHFIDNNSKPEDSWKDMALMNACTHHIVANSSFSWWGAWLAREGGKTFAPRYWFNPQNVKFNINDFVPQSWTIVDYE